MKTEQLRECTNERLEELEKTLRREIFEARIKNFTNQLDDTASIRRARRELARVKTIQSERALGQDLPKVDATEGTESDE